MTTFYASGEAWCKGFVRTTAMKFVVHRFIHRQGVSVHKFGRIVHSVFHRYVQFLRVVVGPVFSFSTMSFCGTGAGGLVLRSRILTGCRPVSSLSGQGRRPVGR